MKELLAGIDALLNWMEKYSDTLTPEEYDEMVQFLQEVNDFIQKLAAKKGAESVAESLSPRIEKLASANRYPSSNVKAVDYDDKTQQLFMQFLGKHPNENGPIYQYDHVPPTVAALMQIGALPAKTTGKNAWGKWWTGKQPSFGASANQLFRNGQFPYKKIA